MKVRGYQVTAYPGSPILWVPGTMQALHDALEQVVDIDNCWPGSEVTIKVVEITQAEADSMPDFDGF